MGHLINHLDFKTQDLFHSNHQNIFRLPHINSFVVGNTALSKLTDFNMKHYKIKDFVFDALMSTFPFVL